MTKRYSTVRRHYRKGKNSVSVVRQHSRRSLSKKLKVLRQKYKIRTPIDVNEIKSPEGSDSFAYTDTVMKDGNPIGHTVNIDSEKIAANNDSIDKIIEHELAHILDKEGKILESPAGKNVIAAIQLTSAFKKLKEKGDSYELKPEEMFARAYAQYRTGHTTPQDIENGYAWEPNDFAIVAKQLKNVIDDEPVTTERQQAKKSKSKKSTALYNIVDTTGSSHKGVNYGAIEHNFKGSNVLKEHTSLSDAKKKLKGLPADDRFKIVRQKTKN